MKIYEGWEVLKMMEENPELIFEDESGTRYLKGVSLTTDYFTNRKWQLVREPVPWQEALQAWIDGKCIYVETEGLRKLEINPELKLGEFVHSGTGIDLIYFEKGTWFIEEAEQ